MHAKDGCKVVLSLLSTLPRAPLHNLRHVGEEAASQRGFRSGQLFRLAFGMVVSCNFQRSKQQLQGGGLVSFPSIDRNQFLPLLIHLILRIEQGTPFLVALGFERLDLLLPGKLLLQRQGCRCGATGFLDLAVDFLDFPFQSYLQVVGPAVELVGFGLEETSIAL